MQDINPIRQARTKLGLGRSEFALKIGCSYTQVAAVELSHTRTLAPSWAGGLASVGLNYEELAAAYQRHRASFIVGAIPVAANA